MIAVPATINAPSHLKDKDGDSYDNYDNYDNKYDDNKDMADYVGFQIEWRLHKIK